MPSTARENALTVAIYARYSSDNQRDASIEDQVRVCREHLARQGFNLIDTYTDRAISGATLLRPGIQTLLADAAQGHFDLVLAEALDRLSRDQADVATLFKHLSFLGIRLVTLAEGEITELHVGLKGTMNALFLKDLAQKTKRGLEGRIRQGRSAGGRVYGYDVLREFDAHGEPLHGGLAINEAEAAIVQRIFQEYAAGHSPRKIAHTLNAEGISGPKGRPWQASVIRGHSRRRNGVLRNELYIGRLVWNRQRFAKDPVTGRRLPRLNPPEALVVTDVPHLRIIDDALWETVRARLDSIEQSPPVQKLRASRFWEKRRPLHLLTGLVRCGVCGESMTAVGGDYLACRAARKFGACTNRRGVARPILENAVFDTLKHHLMAPDLVKEFVTEFHAEVNRQNQSREAVLAQKRRDLAECSRKLDGLVDAIAGGLRSPTLQAKLEALEAQKAALVAEIDSAPPQAPYLHPNLAELYRRRVAELANALSNPALHDEALQLLRGLIEQVSITPEGKAFKVEFIGQIANMLALPSPNEAGHMARHEIAVKGGSGGTQLALLALLRVPNFNWLVLVCFIRCERRLSFAADVLRRSGDSLR